MSKDLPAPSRPDLSSFDWEDPFRLEDQLSEDERMVRDAARAYAEDQLKPRVTRAYAEEATDPSIFAGMGEMGLLGITVPHWSQVRACSSLKNRSNTGKKSFSMSSKVKYSSYSLWLQFSQNHIN